MKAVWLAKLCATVALSAVASFHSTLSEGPSDNPHGFPADPINYDDPLGLFGKQLQGWANDQLASGLHGSDSGNPVTELIDAMGRFDAGLHEFAGAIADANVSAHYGPLNAFYAREAITDVAFRLGTAAARDAMYDDHYLDLLNAGAREGRQKFFDQPIPGVATETRPPSYRESWTMNSARMFEGHLFTALKASTLALPVGGVARGAALAARADLAGGRAAFSLTAGQPMESALFTRIQTAFERHPGRMMLADANSALELDRLSRAGMQVQGQTLSENVIFLRPNPSTSSVYEELIHTAQLRRGMTDVRQMEIEAAQKLIRFGDRYKIPQSETQQTIDRLNALQGNR